MAHAVTAKILFMVVATLCGTKQGVDICMNMADTNLVKDRAACVSRGKELIGLATVGFSYARMPVPYRTSIRCAPKGKTVEQALKLKPDASGTADVTPKVEVKVTPEATAPVSHWYSWFTQFWPY